jgi:hypothetical protein
MGDIDGPGSGGFQTLLVGTPLDDDGGADRGAVYVLKLDGSPIPTDTETAPGLEGYRLGIARPNPFNPTTRISYRIASAGDVQIDIWNAQGRVVRRLAQRRAAPGDYEVTWDGRDDQGRGLPSGTYFYGLTANGQSVAAPRKAILLK